MVRRLDALENFAHLKRSIRIDQRHDGHIESLTHFGQSPAHGCLRLHRDRV